MITRSIAKSKAKSNAKSEASTSPMLEEATGLQPFHLSEPASSAVEEATLNTHERVIASLKTIIRRQELTIATLKCSLQRKDEHIEKLERQTKDLNNYLAEVLLLTLRTRSDIFPEGSKLIHYSDMECDASD